MRLSIDVSRKTFTASKASEPKRDQSGQQRTDKETGLLLWSTQLVVLDEEGGHIIVVTTASANAPDIQAGDEVAVSGLVARPWNASARAGVSYRADSLAPILEDSNAV